MTTTDLRGDIKSYSLEMFTEVCISCGIPFAIPGSYQRILRSTHQDFYCPNGHTQFYPAKSEADKLKEKLREKENELAQKITSNIQLDNQLTAAKEKLNKVAEGQCPCCGKVFKSLAKHMKNKHP